MSVVLVVLASPPVPGRCAAPLLAAHEPAWAAGLTAAMLRDTLDGLMAIDADVRLVVSAPALPAPGEEADVDVRAAVAADALARHVFAPWEVVVTRRDDAAARLTDAAAAGFARREGALVVLACSDAPSAPTEPLASAIARAHGGAQAILGATDNGGFWALGLRREAARLTTDLPWETPAVAATIRARCKELSLAVDELPPWYAVEQPSDVLRLLDELRRHPERAPRSAQYLVTNG